MAGVRAKKTKNGITYTFSGELKECLEKARKELQEKTASQERVFLRWQKDKALKAYENYEKRIKELRDFIPLAEKELKKREEAAGDNDKDGKGDV